MTCFIGGNGVPTTYYVGMAQSQVKLMVGICAAVLSAGACTNSDSDTPSVDNDGTSTRLSPAQASDGDPIVDDQPTEDPDSSDPVDPIVVDPTPVNTGSPATGGSPSTDPVAPVTSSDAGDLGQGGADSTGDAGTGGAPPTSEPVAQPNILLIVSDDQGIDSSSQYDTGDDQPTTPTLDSLAAAGLTFENAWATPACTTTRGTLITGQHGINSGVDRVPDNLSNQSVTLFDYFGATPATQNYATALIGKWHLTNPPVASDPIEAGVGYYAGNLRGVVDDYYNWPLVKDGVETTSTEYHTTVVTNLAIEWVQAQDQPWLLWLSFVAPHIPLHLPPADLHNRNLDGTDIEQNPRAYYLAAIEAMDAEIGRLLASLPPVERERTLVVFVGDNGSPARAHGAALFPRSHVKNSLYEGGLRVPLVVSGPGVSRRGQREAALVNTVDFFPTVAEIAAGADAPAPGMVDGRSFAPLLSSANAPQRQYNYSEFVGATTGWAVRGSQYKLIEFSSGQRELFDIQTDLAESNNLIERQDLSQTISDLSAYAQQIRGN